VCGIRVGVKAQVDVSVSGMSEAWLRAGPGLLMRVCEIKPSLMALVAAWGAVRLLAGVRQPRPRELWARVLPMAVGERAGVRGSRLAMGSWGNLSFIGRKGASSCVDGCCSALCERVRVWSELAAGSLQAFSGGRVRLARMGRRVL
jgi:hypothetical protein